MFPGFNVPLEPLNVMGGGTYGPSRLNRVKVPCIKLMIMLSNVQDKNLYIIRVITCHADNAFLSHCVFYISHRILSVTQMLLYIVYD